MGLFAATAWAQDSIATHELVWPPRADQQRELWAETASLLAAAPGNFVVELPDGSRRANAAAE